jgi:hypothetical protein
MWKVTAMSSLKAAKSRPTEFNEVSRELVTVLSTGSLGVVVGEVVDRRPDGAISVDYPKNTRGPVLARTLTEDVYLGAKVLLAFEMGMSNLPIVLGIVHDRAGVRGRTIRLNADRIVLDAKDEIVLQCGESGIQARRNGTVHLKGKDVVSHATRTNRVRGATVRIN